MNRKHAALIAWVLVVGFVGVVRAAAQDDTPVSLVRFVVLRDYSGKPVKNAAVVMHPVNQKGKQARGGLELKTDSDGHASFDGVPYGPLRVQVLVPGFQTFGEDYDINKPEVEIVVRLKRPQGQYSIYQEHPEAKKEEKPETKKEEKKDDAKPAEQKPQ